MAISRKNAAINNLGSGIATFFECSSTGLVTGSKVEMPRIKTSTLTDTTAQTVLEDEGGIQFSRDGARTVEFTWTMMQQDTDTIKMLIDTYRGKYVQIVKETSNQSIDGNYQYLIIGIGRVIPEFTFTQPGGEVQGKVVIEPAPAAIGVNTANFADTAFKATLTGTVTVAANAYYAFKEVAVV
jgi:hypothetical protein